MGIGLAIPINMASAVKEQLIAGGKVVRGYVGITMNPEGLTPELAESFAYKGEGGVLVTDVLEDSPAAKAGLKQGDIITQLNGKPVPGNDYFRNTVSLMAPGTKIKLVVFRDGKEKNITVEVASLSESKMSSKTSEIGTKLGLSEIGRAHV
jgi:serine protease Do